MEGLDELLDLLTRVKKDGWEDALSDTLYDNNSEQETRHPTYSGPLSAFLRAIEGARVCMKALNEAQRRLGKRLRRLRRLSKPLVLEDGIKRLPDDVLAIIFEMGRHFNEDDPYQFAVCVSHVSHRFRSVALATPSLWTTISDSYGENQTREFISRSGRLDLDIKMPHNSSIESFLEALKDTSYRWSSLEIIEQETEDVMMQLGMTDLPQLRYLTYACPVELSAFSIPRLSQVEGWWWVLPAESCLLSNITHVDFRLSGEGKCIEDLTKTLHSMKNLQDLSLILAVIIGANILPLDNTAFPKPHSVHIDRLAVTILGEKQDHSALLFDALMHLTPSTLELSIYSIEPVGFFFNSEHEMFPFASVIKLHVPHAIDVMMTLVNLMRHCDIVKTVHFDTPMANGLSAWSHGLRNNDDWERIRSLDHLRFTNCDEFTASDVEALTTILLPNEAENGLQSLEIISCKWISEDFLLALHDEVGDRLKWTL
ncbi:hypothetical protein BD410DRAFT_307904 [Rickenella mellea]|uniref:Uncharacterized protein n=1 Tax=Rickenella mellea TaxID=50990 RepID=A0A4Y7Q2W0_9AGAM|nr:hypothetical protein BD410DRAFT_307904 [Rickenella mellea]